MFLSYENADIKSVMMKNNRKPIIPSAIITTIADSSNPMKAKNRAGTNKNTPAKIVKKVSTMLSLLQCYRK